MADVDNGESAVEKERDWYKKEALHLDQVLLKTKRREVSLAEKVEELEQDRTWLSNQLKVIMKERNGLERQLNLKQRENTSNVESESHNKNTKSIQENKRK